MKWKCLFDSVDPQCLCSCCTLPVEGSIDRAGYSSQSPETTFLKEVLWAQPAQSRCACSWQSCVLSGGQPHHVWWWIILMKTAFSLWFSQWSALQTAAAAESLHLGPEEGRHGHGKPQHSTPGPYRPSAGTAGSCGSLLQFLGLCQVQELKVSDCDSLNWTEWF